MGGWCCPATSPAAACCSSRPARGRRRSRRAQGLQGATRVHLGGWCSMLKGGTVLFEVAKAGPQASKVRAGLQGLFVRYLTGGTLMQRLMGAGLRAQRCRTTKSRLIVECLKMCCIILPTFAQAMARDMAVT